MEWRQHQRHLFGAVAVAVQRGTVMAMLVGYTRATRWTGVAEEETCFFEGSEECGGDMEVEAAAVDCLRVHAHGDVLLWMCIVRLLGSW